MSPALSFVVPFMNEEDTLAELFDRIAVTVRPLLGDGGTFEVIFVDDGSTDGSVKRVERLCAQHREVSLIELQGNFGKSAALAAGFDRATGDVVFTLDADLQDDPKEIPRFLAELDNGLDVVSGYKQTRHDPFHKVIPSRVFNWMVRTLTGTRLRDVNCGFKAYRSVVVKNIRLYGELHRFVPVLAHLRRFKVGEITVQHHPRRFGVSKFGARRFFRGFMDLITVFFLLKYERKPSHLIGGFGALCLLAGLVVCGYLSTLWMMGAEIGHRPLLMLGVLLIVVGMQTLATGLIAELLVHLSGHQTPYLVRRVVTGDASAVPVTVERIAS